MSSRFVCKFSFDVSELQEYLEDMHLLVFNILLGKPKHKPQG